MIIVNGTIEVLTASGGGFDAKGYPIPETEAAGQPIKCQYISSRYDAIAKSQGEPITIQSYKILINIRDNFCAERIRLRKSSGDIIGDFSVISIEELKAVCQIQITI